MIAIKTTSPRIRSLLFLIRALFAEVFHPEEAGHPSRDNFLPIKFFAQHAYGGPRKFSRSESSGSNFWFSFVSVQRIELKSIPVV